MCINVIVGLCITQAKDEHKPTEKCAPDFNRPQTEPRVNKLVFLFLVFDER